MLTLTAGKKAAMDRLSTQEGIISALAIDQRGALKKMIKALDVEPTDAQIETFKELVSKELTPYASAILLDPEYGLPAAKARLPVACSMATTREPLPRAKPRSCGRVASRFVAKKCAPR